MIHPIIHPSIHDSTYDPLAGRRRRQEFEFWDWNSRLGLI
jgi:hypothetical protein